MVEQYGKSGYVGESDKQHNSATGEKSSTKRDSLGATINKKAKYWDEVVAVHAISDFQIAEVNRPSGEKWFLAFVNGKFMDHLAHTLDEALIVALCCKYDGSWTHAPSYICRMIGLRTIENGEQDPTE